MANTLTEMSLTGRRWKWRGGNMNVSGFSSLETVGLVDQLLLARGVEPSDLERQRKPTLRGFLPDPAIFNDMEIAAERLAQAIVDQETVTVYGDYDVDGATSAALMILLLRDLGLQANHYIPDRLLEGYGPSADALVAIGKEGSSLIVTVDCGAMAHEALDAARNQGVDVIVVDHHKCSPELPNALALVNPNRLDESAEAASFGHLAAVGVAFLLAIALVRTLRGRGFFDDRAEPNLIAYLDLVALGTVADVAALRGLNRAFVAQGLKVMAHRKNIGLSALIDCSRLTRSPICSDLGFALGPRINAGGRVGEADLGVRLLTSLDGNECADIAADLDQYNNQRRAIEAAVQEEAEAQLATKTNLPALILSGQGWHPGVIGIVAGRIKEKTGKPVIVIALDADGTGKGSGRSISGVDLGAVIMAAKERELLVAGGGHAMAAGLTIEADKLDKFENWLCNQLESKVAKASASKSLSLDMAIAPRGLTPDLAEALDAAGPFGMGWPSPLIAVGPVRVVKCDIVGTDHVRAIVAGDDGRSFKAMAFRQAESELGQSLLHGTRGRKLMLAGRIKVDHWTGRPQAELHIEDAAWHD